MILDRQLIRLTTFFSETGGWLENKHHVSDLESTETVKCSEDESNLGQNVSWYYVSTGEKIKSGGRIELNGLSLKIKNVQLDDAGTYECRGVSIRRYMTIYVNGEFSLCTCCSSIQHHLFCHVTIMLCFSFCFCCCYKYFW